MASPRTIRADFSEKLSAILSYRQQQAEFLSVTKEEASTEAFANLLEAALEGFDGLNTTNPEHLRKSILAVKVSSRKKSPRIRLGLTPIDYHSSPKSLNRQYKETSCSEARYCMQFEGFERRNRKMAWSSIRIQTSKHYLLVCVKMYMS